MNLHNDIMNIPAKPEVDYEEDAHCSDELQMDFEIWYKNGHRDARHAAAELALDAERKIQELEQEIRELKESESDWCCSDCGSDHQSLKIDHPAWDTGE